MAAQEGARTKEYRVQQQKGTTIKGYNNISVIKGE
jgi:hypothetical protein